MSQITLFLGLSLAPSGDSGRYPVLVQSIIDGTKQGTSEVDWTLNWQGGREAGLRERHTTRRAAGDVWESNRGDENGLHARTFRDAPRKGMSDEQIDQLSIPKEDVAGTRNKALVDGRVWYLPTAEYPLIGYSVAQSEPQRWQPIAFEVIGLVPAWVGESSENAFRIPKHHFQDFENAKFETRRGSRFSVVTATFGEGLMSLTWTFDSTLSNSPIRAELTKDGAPLYRSETTYGVAAGRASPMLVEFYEGAETKPQKSIEVERSSFDQPWHLKEITPQDIGVLPGTQLNTSSGLDFWTGAELVDHEEFWPLVYSDPDVLHPRMAEILAEQTHQTVKEYRDFLTKSGENWRKVYTKEHGFDPWEDDFTAKKSEDKDPWDEYVEEFLAENKLPDAGVTRAKEILKQAKSLRDARRKQNAAKIREAKKENDQRKLEKFVDIEKSIFDRMLVRNLKCLVPEKKPDATTP